MLLDVPELLFAIAIVTIGAMVQATVGVGLGLIAAPFLLLINPQLVPGPLMLNGVVLAFMVAFRNRQGIDFTHLKFALAGRVLGLLPAALLLSLASQRVFDMTFASMVLSAVLLSALGLTLQPTKIRSMIAGFASGFMGTISGIGGPPIALLYQRSSANELRGTLSAFFSVGATLSLGVLAWVGRFGAVECQLAVCLFPGIMAGSVLSGVFSSRLPTQMIRPLILGVSMGAAIAVLWRAIANS